MRKLMLMAVLTAFGYMAVGQEVDMSLIPYRKGDKWGYVTPDKKVVIEPKYAEAAWFSEGLAAVKVGKKWGYINKSGKLVIPARYTIAKSFRKGFMPGGVNEEGVPVIFAGASLTNDGYEICINEKGTRMPKCPAIPESSVEQNQQPVASVNVRKTYSVPNSQGLFDQIVDDYTLATGNETYYIAVKGNRYGVFNSKFEEVVPFIYDSMRVNRDSRTPFLQVKKNGMVGILLADGTMGIEPVNESVYPITTNDGVEYVIVKQNGKTYVKDYRNKDLIAKGYNDIVYDEEGGFIITGDNATKGYYFLDNSVIEPKYKEIQLMDGGKYLQITTNKGKVGYISTNGDEYFDE